MTELYLIAHKVRGEPAFDIAHKLQIGDEEGWIIPTSGHRAYPSDYIELSRLMTAAGEYAVDHMALPDASWPDHYRATAAKPERKAAAKDLLKSLGFAKPTDERIRRV